MSAPRLFRHCWICQSPEANAVESRRSSAEIAVLAYDTRRERLVQIRLLLQPQASWKQLQDCSEALSLPAERCLAPALEWGEDEGGWFLITPMVNGPTLANYLGQDLSIRCDQAAALCLLAFAAMEATAERLNCAQDFPLQRLRVARTDHHPLGIEVVMAHPSLQPAQGPILGLDLAQSSRPLLQALQKQATLSTVQLANLLEPCLRCLQRGAMAALPSLRTPLMQLLRATPALPPPESLLPDEGDGPCGLPQGWFGEQACLKLMQRQELVSCRSLDWIWRSSAIAAPWTPLPQWIQRQSSALDSAEIDLLLAAISACLDQAEDAGLSPAAPRLENFALQWSRADSRPPQVIFDPLPNLATLTWQGLHPSLWLPPGLEPGVPGAAWLAAAGLALQCACEPGEMNSRAASSRWQPWLKRTEGRSALLLARSRIDPAMSLTTSIGTAPEDPGQLADEPAEPGGFAELLFGVEPKDTMPVEAADSRAAPWLSASHAPSADEDRRPLQDDEPQHEGSWLLKALAFIVLSMTIGAVIAWIHADPTAHRRPVPITRQKTQPESLPFPSIEIAPAPTSSRPPALSLPPPKPQPKLRLDLEQPPPEQGGKTQRQ